MAKVDVRVSAERNERLPRKIRRRLDEATWREIAEKYRLGATTPALCVEYGVSKGGILKLLRDQGVEMRCQPLGPEQIEQGALLYGDGSSIQAIADQFDVSYNSVRQAFVRAGIERRSRGGSRPRS